MTPGFCGSLMHYALPRSMPLSVPLLSLQPATFLLLGLGSGALSRQCLLWTLSPGVLGTIDIWDQHCLSPQSSAANPASLQSPLPTGQALGPWEQPHPFLSKPLPLGTLRLSAAPHTRPPDLLLGLGSLASGGQWASPPRGRLLETLRSWHHHKNP